MADTSQPAMLGPHGRAQDVSPRHAGGPKHAFGGPASLQQFLWQRLSDELGMALGARENNALVVGHSRDPLRLETLALQQALKPRGVERHDQDVANGISRQRPAPRH